MSTVLELSKEVEEMLDQRSRDEHLSREELVTRALVCYPAPLKTESEAEPWPELDAVFGIWKHRGEDTFAYLRRIRGE